MSNCTTPYTRFPFLCGNKKAKTVCLGLIVFLERVTGLQICCANLNPRNRRLLRRFPKNVLQARFLNGNPPHRFDPLYLAVTKQPRQSVLAVSLYGAGDGNRTRVLGLGSPHNSHYTTPAFASIILLRCPFSKGFRGFP